MARVNEDEGRTFAARIVMCRAHGTSGKGRELLGEPTLRITLRDEVSHQQFAEVELPITDAGYFLTSGDTACTVTLRHLDKVGRRPEFKDVDVVFDGARPGETKEDAIARVLAPYEVDGWRGNPDHVGNHHRSNGGGHWNVTFARYVDADGGGK